MESMKTHRENIHFGMTTIPLATSFVDIASEANQIFLESHGENLSYEYISKRTWFRRILCQRRRHLRYDTGKFSHPFIPHAKLLDLSS
jgi:hypothetical protein